MPDPITPPSTPAPPRALGRRPHDPQRPVLKLADYLTGEIPSHPGFADYLANVPAWGLYGNNRYGDCGPAAVANQRRQVSQYLGGDMNAPTVEDVFDLYRRAGNPNFDPATGTGDNGVVLADLLTACVTGGIGGVKALGYAAVDVTDPDEVRAAIALFGSLLFGVDLDVAQRAQTDAHTPWDYVRRSSDWGGHCVLAGAYTSSTAAGTVDISVISWAERIGTTDAFCGRQLAEAYVVIWPELLGTTEFDAGVDLAALARDYQALTGRPFPHPPTPPAPPTPAPPVGPPSPHPRPRPDTAFRAQLATFVEQAQAWLAAGDGAS